MLSKYPVRLHEYNDIVHLTMFPPGPQFIEVCLRILPPRKSSMRYGVILAMLLCCGQASAMTIGRAKPFDVYSQNGAYVVAANPNTHMLTVYAAQDRNTPLWSFTEIVGQGSVFIANDGRVVVTVVPCFSNEKEFGGAVGVGFWNKTGKFKSYTVSELCPDPEAYDDYYSGLRYYWYREMHSDGDRLLLKTRQSPGALDCLPINSELGDTCEFNFADGQLEQHSYWDVKGVNSRRLAVWEMVGIVFLATVCMLLSRRPRAAALAVPAKSAIPTS